MKNNTAYLLLAIAALSCISCKKEKNEPQESNTQKILLSSFFNASLGQYEYFYDDNGRLTSEKFTPTDTDNPGTLKTIDSYDDQGRITQYTVTYTSGESYLFTHSFGADGNVNIRRLFDKGTGDLLEYNEYSHSIGKLVYEFFRAPNTLTRVYEYTYGSPEFENIIEDKQYSGATGTLLSTVTYEYDDKKSPWRLFPTGHRDFKTSANNVTKATYSLTSATYNYTLEYNSDGYPVKVLTETGTVAQTFEYIKK